MLLLLLLLFSSHRDASLHYLPLRQTLYELHQSTSLPASLATSSELTSITETTEPRSELRQLPYTGFSAGLATWFHRRPRHTDRSDGSLPRWRLTCRDSLVEQYRCQLVDELIGQGQARTMVCWVSLFIKGVTT